MDRARKKKVYFCMKYKTLPSLKVREPPCLKMGMLGFMECLFSSSYILEYKEIQVCSLKIQCMYFYVLYMY